MTKNKLIQCENIKIISFVYEAIEELIVLSKELVTSQKQKEDLGLKDYEYAFYEAIAQNESTKEVMSIKKNITFDWQHKENICAKLRIAVKKVLQKLAIE